MLSTTVKNVFSWQIICLFCFLTSFQMEVTAQPSTFKHTATTSNTTNNYTLINHGRTNGQPNKIIFVTHDYGSGPYVKSPLGVWYTNGKWSIFQQDRKPLPKNAKFNVLVQTTADRGVFVHKATRNNIGGHITTIDDPNTNGKPNAKIIVTQHWGDSRAYNNHSIGVYYQGGKWRIFNQDFGKMPEGAMFNIMVNHTKSFQHTATGSSMKMGHVTNLNHSNTNNASNAFVFVTQCWTSVYNPHPVGVWYSGGKWTVYNEDRVKMPANSKFNIVAFSLNSNPQNDSTPKVTKATLKAINPSVVRGRGRSVEVISFKGTITFNGRGTVKYRFIRSDGAKAPTKSLYFDRAGTKSVSTEWHLGKSYQGWQAIEIISPNKMQSNKANFTIR